MDTGSNAGSARLILSIIGFLSLAAGLILFFIGLLIFLGVNVIDAFLPKAVSSVLLPSDVAFLSAFGMISGISLIVVSRLFHTSGKWLKHNEKKGGILAILLATSSLAGLFLALISLNLTIIGYVFYIIVLLYIGVIVSVLIGWKNMTGGLDEVLPGVGSFLAAGFFIFILFAVLYTLFPVQSVSLSSVGTQSIFSVFTGSFGHSTFRSAVLNYSYPNYLININLNGILSSASSLLSLSNSSNMSTQNISKILDNTSLNLLIPNSFLVSAIGNSPEFASDLKSINITKYLEQNSSENARKYLESYFPQLNQFYFIITGKEHLNSSSNISIFHLSPSQLGTYLKKFNITTVNSSFPINITKYMLLNATYNKTVGRYLPSQLLLINMSNHVGIEVVYDSEKLFNLTRIPFYSAAMSMYIQNSTVCFEFGADFPSQTENEFNLSTLYIQRTIKCG